MNRSNSKESNEADITEKYYNGNKKLKTNH